MALFMFLFEFHLVGKLFSSSWMRDCKYSLEHVVAGSKQILTPTCVLFHIVVANVMFGQQQKLVFLVFGTSQIAGVKNYTKRTEQDIAS